MRTCFRIWIVFSIMLLVMGIDAKIYPFSVLNGSTKNGDPESSASIYAIPQCDLFNSISNAVYKGDANQAIRLYRYYKFSDESKSDELFWLYVAMKLEHQTGIRLYAAKINRGDIKETSFWDKISNMHSIFHLQILNEYRLYRKALAHGEDNAEYLCDKLRKQGVTQRLLSPDCPVSCTHPKSLNER